MGKRALRAGLAVALIESGPDALLLVDIEGRIVFANSQAIAVFGYSPGELLGQSVDLLVPVRLRVAHAAHRKAFSQAPCARPMGAGLAPVARRKDGTEFAVEISLSPVRTKEASFVAVAVRDASERRQVEHTLRESEDRFRTALDEAPIGMAIVGLDGRFVRVNRALGQMVGYSPEELIGLTFQTITHPDDIALDSELAIQLARREIPKYQVGKRCLRKDGTLVNVMLSASIVRDRHGHALYHISQVDDVTRRRTAEDALRKSEAALRRSEAGLTQAQRVAHMGSWEWDLCSNEFSRSQEMHAIFGDHPRSELSPPHQLAQLVVRQDREPLLREIQRALGQNGSFAIEARVASMDGTERIVLHQGKVIVEEGVPARFVGTCSDITDRKRAEREHQESLRWLQALLDQAAVGMLLVHGPPDYRLEPNARALEMIGRPIDAVDQYPGLLESSDGQPLARDEFPSARALRGERIEATEYLLHHPDRVIPILASAAPIVGPDRRVQGAVVAFLDISANKELERQRAEWSAVVAHDLRQPINTIGMSAQTLVRLTDDEKLCRPVAQIQAAARRLDRMVDDLMDLSRLEARRLELTRQPIDVPATVRETIQRVEHQSRGRRFEVIVESEPPRAYADSDRVAQIVENLLANAVKYGTAGTPILVNISRSGADVVVAVANEGEPVPEEEMTQMFGRFRRTAAAKLAGVKGTGLGLYIARELVEAHGGTIGVQCTPAGRMTFRFTLPVAK